MYNEYFHFTELPFSIAPDPHFMFMSARHQEGLAHLLYGVSHGGGFVALTGEVGTGKTTLCHCLLQQLPENIDIALILNPKLNAVELLASICDELRIDYDHRRPSLKMLVDALNHHLLEAHANRRRTVLMIDEAQNLSLPVLEQIRLLTNLETSKTKLLQIILVGQPELKDLLERPELRQLNQRITARYHLEPFTLDETRIYIRHRLFVCKGNPELFKDSAIRKIFRLSKGIPRLINVICHNALLGAYSQELNVITPAIIEKAVKETLTFNSAIRSLVKPLLGILALSCLVAAIIYKDKFKPQSTAPETAFSAVAQPIPQPTPATAATTESPTSGSQVKPALVARLRPFGAWLDDSSLTLPTALKNILATWGKEVPDKPQIDCITAAQKAGLNCLFDKGNWKDMIAFNRPTILEFSPSPGIKRYALLTSVDGDRVTFDFGRKITFSLSDVLTFWNGYYLLLWQSPKPGLTGIVPWKSSDQVLWLRERMTKIDGFNQAVKWPRFFDTALRNRLFEFQKKQGLPLTGRLNAKTIIYLDNVAGVENSPTLQKID